MAGESLEEALSREGAFESALGTSQQIPLSDGPLGEAARYVCRAWAGTPTYRLLLAPLGIPTACSPYLDSIGRGVPSVAPPFEGGQCNAEYQVTVTAKFALQNGQESDQLGTVVGLGPVAEVFSTFFQGFHSVFVIFANGAQAAIGGVPPNDIGLTITSIDVARTDNQPDSCGSPPPVFQPGGGYEGENFGDTFNYNYEGDDYSVTVGIPVSIEGRVEIPVSVEVGDVSLDFNFGQKGGGVAELPAEGDALVGSPVPPDENGEGEPNPPIGKECVGIAVSILGDSSGFGLVPSAGANEIYPRVVGNACLLLRSKSGDSPSFWTEDFKIQNKFSSKFRPEKGLTVVRWRVKILDDVEHTVRPIYLEV